jgi:hypothetical protein
MNNWFPALICFIGAAAFIRFGFKLKRFRVPLELPVSRPHLTAERRQAKIRMAMWICFVCGSLLLAAATFVVIPRHTP